MNHQQKVIAINLLELMREEAIDITNEFDSELDNTSSLEKGIRNAIASISSKQSAMALILIHMLEEE